MFNKESIIDIADQLVVSLRSIICFGLVINTIAYKKKASAQLGRFDSKKSHFCFTLLTYYGRLGVCLGTTRVCVHSNRTWTRRSPPRDDVAL